MKAGQRAARWSRLWGTSLVCSALMLTGCGGGGGGNSDTATAPKNDVQPASVPWSDATVMAMAEEAPTPSTDVTVDTTQLHLYYPSEPQQVSKFTMREAFMARSPGANALNVQRHDTLFWISQGRIYRKSLTGPLDAAPTQVSGLSSVCRLSSLRGGPDRIIRNDDWLLVMLADADGQCPEGAPDVPQRLVKPDAGLQDMGVAAGSWSDVLILGPLRTATGGRGAVLMLQRAASTLVVMDPSGQGALGTKGVGFKPATGSDVTVDEQLGKVRMLTMPEVGWQTAVVTYNQQLFVLDWRSGKLVWHDTGVVLGAGEALNTVQGPFGGDFLVATDLHVWRVSQDGAARELAAAPSGDASAGLALSFLGGSAIVQQTTTVNAQPTVLNAWVLNPAAPATTQPPTVVAAKGQLTPAASDALFWAAPGGARINQLVRTNGTTGLSGAVSGNGNVIALDRLTLHDGLGHTRRIMLYLVPSGNFNPTLPFPVLDGSRLYAYDFELAKTTDLGTLPSLPAGNWLNLAPAEKNQVTTGTVGVLGVTGNAADGPTGTALLKFEVDQANSLKLVTAGLPWPF